LRELRSDVGIPKSLFTAWVWRSVGLACDDQLPPEVELFSDLQENKLGGSLDVTEEGMLFGRRNIGGVYFESTVV
jgi:hypothetical protein